MLKKYLLIVSAFVVAMAFFVFYEETENDPIEQSSPIVSVEIPNEFVSLQQLNACLSFLDRLKEKM